MGRKISHQSFVERSIKALRQPPYRGIHVVYSNFHNAFREYYGEDPRPVIEKLEAEGFIVTRPSRGGLIMMLTSDVYEKEATSWDVTAALGKILDQN
jgi:hypothetical protein